MKCKGYTGTCEYSADDGCYHGKIAFIRDLITYEGESLEELETAFREAVERYLECYEETGRAANRRDNGRSIPISSSENQRA